MTYQDKECKSGSASLACFKGAAMSSSRISAQCISAQCLLQFPTCHVDMAMSGEEEAPPRPSLISKTNLPRSSQQPSSSSTSKKDWVTHHPSTCHIQKNEPTTTGLVFRKGSYRRESLGAPSGVLPTGRRRMAVETRYTGAIRGGTSLFMTSRPCYKHFLT